jgi:ABC-2 type transport system permease protein
VVFVVLVKREVKAFLKNPAFIASILLIIAMYGFMGAVMRSGVEQARQVMLEASVGLVLEDDTELTRALARLLNETLQGRVHLSAGVERALEVHSVVVVIPRGFTMNATSEPRIGLLEFAVRADRASLTMLQVKSGLISQLSRVVERLLPKAMSEVYGVSQRVEVDVRPRRVSALFYGREVDLDSLIGMLGSALTIPMFVSIVYGINAGYAAQLVAFEKVEKAFEMLLAQPIKRSRVVLAKIVGAALATLAYMAAFVVAIMLMFAGFSGVTPQGDGAQVTIVAPLVELGSHVLAFVALAVLIGLLQSGAVGILLGSISQEERTAGLLVMPVMMVYFGLAFAVMFLGLDPTSLNAVVAGLVVAALPSIHLLSMLAGTPQYSVLALGISVSLTLALVALAVFVFNRELVILGVKVRVRRSPPS